MTVGDMKKMLSAVPDDCDGLPIMAHGQESRPWAIWEVIVMPPNNEAGEMPAVILRHNEWLARGSTPLVITFPRRGM